MRNKYKKTKILTKIFVFIVFSLLLISILYPIGYATKQNEEEIIQQIKQTPNKILMEEKTIGDIHVKYWIHKINNIEIKNDYILLQRNAKDDKIVKYEKQWRNIQKIPSDVSLINFDDSDIAWKNLVIFLEKNDLNNFYSIYNYNNQEFPLVCWEVRYNNGITSLINANGQRIGEGVPAPSEYKGFSLSGFCEINSPDCWRFWRDNADNWFQKWCISTTSISLPTPDTISSYVNNSEYSLFYELAHGDSTYFQANNPGVYYYAFDVEQDMTLREKMVFSFIGSCEGMTYTDEGTFSYEFRKGTIDDTVTVGYSGMGTCPGWSVSLPWQNFMFYVMDSNFTIYEAFNLACAQYPTIADCVVFVGDPTLKIIERGGNDDDDDEILPNVVITYPTENSVVSGDIKISGIADDLDGVVNEVYVKIDDGDWEEASGTNYWEIFWDTNTVSDGQHTITAIAIDNNDLQSGCCYLNVYVVNDFLETNIITTDQALINQEIIFESSTSGGIPPYNYTWDFGDETISYNSNTSHIYKKIGTYNVKLVTRDSVNISVNDTTEIIITETDNISPVIELIEPENALYISNNKILPLLFIVAIGDITIQANVSDSGGSGLEKVEFYLDDTLMETFTSSSNSYQWTWDTIAFFKHKITIKAYDHSGNINTIDIDIFKFG